MREEKGGGKQLGHFTRMRHGIHALKEFILLGCLLTGYFLLLCFCLCSLPMWLLMEEAYFTSTLSKLTFTYPIYYSLDVTIAMIWAKKVMNKLAWSFQNWPSLLDLYACFLHCKRYKNGMFIFNLQLLFYCYLISKLETCIFIDLLVIFRATVRAFKEHFLVGKSLDIWNSALQC